MQRIPVFPLCACGQTNVHHGRGFEQQEALFWRCACIQMQLYAIRHLLLHDQRYGVSLDERAQCVPLVGSDVSKTWA